VEARLGREPQDMLEAAVALEAWAGVPAGDALRTGAAMMRSSAPASRRSAGRPPAMEAGAGGGGAALEALAFVVAVVAIACWAAPLADSLGRSAVERALVVALPMTLALQWGLASRYLSRPDGLAHLGRRPRTLVAAGLAVVAVPAVLIGQGGLVAGLLTVAWTGGTIVVRRRWAPAYAAAVVLSTAAMVAGVDPTAVLAATALATAVAVGAAVRARVPAPAERPAGWRRAAAAAAIGAGLGVLLVTDRTVDWSLGAIPALALLPSSVASFWGGRHLWKVHRAIPETLAGVPLPDARARGLGRGPLRILAGAVGRLVVLTVLLSAAVLGAAWALGVPTSGEGVLGGFGLVALATMLVSLLESVGRALWPLVGLGAGIAGELIAQPQLESTPGGALIVGGSIAVLVLLPVVLAMLARPARTLATALWIR
jgi:hypothetical protein